MLVVTVQVYVLLDVVIVLVIQMRIKDALMYALTHAEEIVTMVAEVPIVVVIVRINVILLVPADVLVDASDWPPLKNILKYTLFSVTSKNIKCW